MTRFIDATGVLGDAVAIAALASRVPGFSRLRAGGRRLSLVVVLVAALIPLGSGLSLAAYLRGATGDLSITSLLLLILYLLRFSGMPRQPQAASAGGELLLALVALTAVVFYPLALGWGSFDPYRLGYGSDGLLATLLVLALAAAFRRMPLVAASVALAVLAWSVGWYASPNLWDYLLDPLLSVYAIAALGRHALRRRRQRARGLQ